MSKALNIIGGLAILWVFLHAIWNIGNFEGLTGDLAAAQRFEGILALAIGICLVTIFMKLARSDS